MSASEKLAALAVTHERVLPIFRRVGPEDWKRDRPAESVMDALPEIVAVVEAAEAEAHRLHPGRMAECRDPMCRALAALEEKLGGA